MPALLRLLLTLAILPAGPAAVVGDGSTIAIPAEGGGVAADIYGTGEHAVVLVHGGRFDRKSWKPQVPALVAAGLRVLAIDLRAVVASRGGQESPCLYDESCLARDVLAAIRYLHGQGARRVSVLGGSLGGGAAAQAAVEADAGEIDRLVLLAPMPIARPEAIKGRKLFVVARGDLNASGKPRLEAIRDQYDRAPEPKRLVVLEGSAHAQFIFDSPGGQPLMAEIVKFLSER